MKELSIEPRSDFVIVLLAEVTIDRLAGGIIGVAVDVLTGFDMVVVVTVVIALEVFVVVSSGVDV